MCYKYGALWGYFARRDDVAITMKNDAALQSYVRSDPGSGGDISFNRCSHCGCMMCWFRVDSSGAGVRGKGPQVGVNCRMLPMETIESVERRCLSGKKKTSDAKGRKKRKTHT